MRFCIWPADRMLESLPCTQVARLLDAEGVWRELASGFRAVVSATDVAKSRHATLARVESPAALDWRRLSEREQSVVSWAARGLSQKVVRRIIELTGAQESQIEHVTDRPGHDRRYSLSSEKVRALGWAPRVRFGVGLEQTVSWYRENAWWWEPIRSGDYRAYYERQYGRSLQP